MFCMDRVIIKSDFFVVLLSRRLFFIGRDKEGKLCLEEKRIGREVIKVRS